MVKASLSSAYNLFVEQNIQHALRAAGDHNSAMKMIAVMWHKLGHGSPPRTKSPRKSSVKHKKSPCKKARSPKRKC